MRLNRRIGVLIAALTTLAAGGGVASARAIDTATPLCGTAKMNSATASLPTGGPRIASYNMLHGLTTDGDRTLEARLAIDVEELAASHVDIVGIQEAEESTKHGLVIKRLADKLAVRTQQSWFWCWFRTEPHLNGTPDTRVGGGNYFAEQLAKNYNSNEPKWYEGAAVLSRWPIVASAVHRLPGEDPVKRLRSDCQPPTFSGDPTCVIDIVLEPRAAVWTRIRTPRGSLSFTSTHTSGTWAQSLDLVRWVRAKSKHDASAYLVCDCNSTPHSSAQAAIRSHGWVDTYRALHPTGGATADQDITATKPTTSARIDYVFMRTPSALRPVGVTPFMNVPKRSPVSASGWLWPSDHWGVLATLG
jgi:endonuclease/exonuclease/phosphatase family metal-dependent hydrolase